MQSNFYELATSGPPTMALEARKHIATFCAIRAVAARKTLLRRQEGMPRDIVMKLKAALGLLHKHMA